MCAMVNRVRTLPKDMENILRNLNSVKSRMDTMEERLSALEHAGGFGGPGGGGAGAKKRAAVKRKAEATAQRRGGLDDIEEIP